MAWFSFTRNEPLYALLTGFVASLVGVGLGTYLIQLMKSQAAGAHRPLAARPADFYFGGIAIIGSLLMVIAGLHS